MRWQQNVVILLCPLLYISNHLIIWIRISYFYHVSMPPQPAPLRCTWPATPFPRTACRSAARRSRPSRSQGLPSSWLPPTTKGEQFWCSFYLHKNKGHLFIFRSSSYIQLILKINTNKWLWCDHPEVIFIHPIYSLKKNYSGVTALRSFSYT